MQNAMQDAMLFQDDLQTLCNSQALFGLLRLLWCNCASMLGRYVRSMSFGQCEVAKIIGLVFVHPLPVSLAYGMSVSLKS